MLIDILLVALVIHAIATFVASRRGRVAIGHTGLLSGVLLLMAWAWGSGEPYWHAVAMGMSALTLWCPAGLEALAHVGFTRGHLRWAVWISGVRAMLMPGAGLSQQQEILAGVALLQPADAADDLGQAGVDRSIAYYRRLLQGDADAIDTAVIHEQIVGMLLWGERWRESVEHYERAFHPSYASLRPALAVGLMRAYGELGAIDRAARLLTDLETGPLGGAAQSSPLLSQARVVFLAYAGDVRSLDRVVERDRSDVLGISSATANLLHGVALMRVGELERARASLAAVERLARPGDHRVLVASRALLARPPAPLDPSISVSALASDMQRTREAVARMLAEGWPRPAAAGAWGTTAISVGMVVAWVASGVSHGGGRTLITAGAMWPELDPGGAAARMAVAAWLHSDALTLALDVAIVWIAGRRLESRLGAAWILAIYCASAVLAQLCAWAFGAALSDLIGGAGAGALALAVAALVLRPPPVDPRPVLDRRRAWAVIPLVIASALLVSTGLAGLGTGPWHAIVAGSLGTAAGLLARPPRSRALNGVALGAVALWVMASLAVAMSGGAAQRTRPLAQQCTFAQGTIVVDAGFRPIVSEGDDAEQRLAALSWLGVPVIGGLYDATAAAGGAWVQLQLVRMAADEDAPALLTLSPAETQRFSLTRERSQALPWPETDLPHDTAVWSVRRNGEAIAWLVERSIDAGDGTRVAATLLVWPLRGWTAGAQTYVDALASLSLLDARAEAGPTGPRDRPTCRRTR